MFISLLLFRLSRPTAAQTAGEIGLHSMRVIAMAIEKGQQGCHPFPKRHPFQGQGRPMTPRA